MNRGGNMFDEKQQEVTLTESALLKTGLFRFEIQPKWDFECSKPNSALDLGSSCNCTKLERKIC